MHGYTQFGAGTKLWAIPYDRKLMTLHEIKVLEVNAIRINAKLVGNDFQIKERNEKERVTFPNGRKLTRRHVTETKLVETTGTNLKVREGK